MKESRPADRRERTLRFAVDVIKTCRLLPNGIEFQVIIRQIIRSSSSIGANLEEAKGARTRPEFTSCTNIARREARETLYWLKILMEIVPMKIQSSITELIEENKQIVGILTASIKTLSHEK